MKNYLKTLSLALMAVFASVNAFADNVVSIADFSISAGEKKTIELNIDNDVAIRGFQVDIDLPTGLTIVENSWSKSSRLAGKHTLAVVQQPDGDYRFLCTVFGDIDITGNSGAVASFTVQASNTLAKTSNISFNEGTVSKLAANGGGSETLYGSVTKVTKVVELDGPVALVATESPISILPGETATVSVEMNNECTNQLSGISGKIVLPQGLTIEGSDRDGYIVAADRVRDANADFNVSTGAFMVISQSATQIQGNNGVIFTFVVKADETLAENSKIQLTELTLTDRFTDTYVIDDLTIDVTNGAFANEAAAVEAAQAKLAELNAALQAIVLDEAVTAFNNNEVKPLVGTFSGQKAQAAQQVNQSIASIINYNQGKVSTDEVQALLEAAYAAAETAIANVQAAADAAQAKYDEVKPLEDAALEQANKTVESLQNEIAALTLSDEVLASTDANVIQLRSQVQGMMQGFSPLMGNLLSKLNIYKDNLTNETNAADVQSAVDAVNSHIAAVKAAIAAAEEAQQKVAAEEAAKKEANEKAYKTLSAELDELTQSLNTTTTVLAINYPDADMTQEIAAVRKAIADEKAALEAAYAAVELTAESTNANADAIRADIAKLAAIAKAKQKAYEDAQDAEAQEAAAKAEAQKQIDDLKAAVPAISDELKSDEREAVKEAVAEAEKAIQNANEKIDAAQTSLDAAEGKLTTDAAVAETVNAALDAAEEAVVAAKAAVAAAEQAAARKPGDITGTGEVTDADLDAFIEKLTTGNLPKEGDDDFYVFDANGDGNVNVADLQAIFNLTMGLNADGSDPGAAARAFGNDFVAGNLNMSAVKLANGNTRFDISLSSTADYRAFQMDLKMNGAMRVAGETANVNLRSSDNGSYYRIVGWGQLQNGNIVSIEVEGNGNVQFDNVMLATADAQAVAFTVGSTTGISTLAVEKIEGAKVYDLSGKETTGLTKGINIVRSDDGTVKKVMK